MSELLDSVDTEETLTGSDLATDTAEVQEENTEVNSEQAETETTPEVDEKAIENERVQKAINKQHRLRKEAEREAEALRQERDELRAKSQSVPDGPVELPAMPDPYDDDFEQRLQAREKAIATNAEWNVQQNIRANQEAQIANQRRAQQAKHQEELNQTFEKNITRLGVNDEQVLDAANTLAQFGADADLANFIMTDDDGPLVAMHFANDLQGFEEFMSLPAMQRGRKLNDVVAAASSYRPKPTNTPDPAPSVGGKTAAPSDGPAGATYE